MLFAHLKRILKLDRLRLRGPMVRVTIPARQPPRPQEASEADTGTRLEARLKAGRPSNPRSRQPISSLHSGLQ